MRLNSKQIVLYTGGRFLIEPIDASEILLGISWDSREVEKGDLYVALPGERVDGHEFVEAALRAGARAALVTETPSAPACVLAQELGVAVIEVPNTMHAIEDLASAWRDFIAGKVVAVTGSVGKTTTKNLVRDVCSAKFRTVATMANQNNELGVPNTILSADPDTQVVIVEMGMRGLGQISKLCKIARPDWGVVTNVGESHMELLGSKENIARAKGELFDALPSGSGRAFANFEDEFTPTIVKAARLSERGVVAAYFGHGAKEAAPSPRVWPEDEAIDAEGRAEFKLCIQGFKPETGAEPTLFDMEPDMTSAPCHLSVRGAHNVTNACAAAAVGAAFGMEADEIAKALSASTPEAGRLETLKARDGYVVVNDAYNANPDSMRAALKMLASMHVDGRRIAVLGDMGELGEQEASCHAGVGTFAAGLSREGLLDGLVCIGELSENMAKAALDGGMLDDQVVCASSIGEALEALEGNLDAADAVLVKASHFMRLDRLVEGLLG